MAMDAVSQQDSRYGNCSRKKCCESGCGRNFGGECWKVESKAVVKALLAKLMTLVIWVNV